MSWARSRPSMLIRMPACARRLVNTVLVNCAPWSELRINGRPHCNASSRQSRQNRVSKVLESRHASTLRLCQSRIAAR